MKRSLMHIAKMISTAREAKGVSLQLLADAAGLSLHQVRRVERGTAVTNAVALVKIAKLLELDLDELFSEVVPDTQRVDELWKHARMADRIAGSRPADFRAKKAILEAMNLWDQ